jgi:hypothetical protein
VEAAVEAMVGLHSSDPVAVYLSAYARTRRFRPTAMERALYEDRTLVRILGMRRTMFVVPVALAGPIDVSCAQVLAPPERRRLIGYLEEQGVAADGAAWLDDVCARTLAALRRRGEATAVEVSRDVPELTTKLRFGAGKTWGGDVGVSTRVLFLLAVEGAIVRGRPRGSWISSQYRWSTTETWLGEPLATPPLSDAGATLVRAYLRAFGPASRTDLRWWTGWTVRQLSAALDAIEIEEVEIEDAEPGFLLADDDAAVRRPAAWAALLPSLDPTTMGWKLRAWYLGDHAEALFDRNGNAGPTVWANGRVVGGWSQRPDGEIRVGLLEAVDRTAAERIDAERERLARWLGDVRLTPRFRTPLERELANRR